MRATGNKPISKTRLLALLKDLDWRAVKAALKEHPDLRNYRSDKGQSLLHLCCGIEIEKHDQHVALLSQSPRRVVVDVDPDLQPGMPQPSADASRTPGPAKPGGKQFGDQRPRFRGKHFDITGRPQAAGVEFHRRGAAQHGVGNAERQTRCRLPKQLQRTDKASSPESATSTSCCRIRSDSAAPTPPWSSGG